MAARRVFLLSSGRLTVYHFARGRVLEPLAFAADDGGLRQFSIYLDREPDVPAVMLVDLVEEEFREETVPHVWGADRRALVRNKKNRLFRDPRFSQAIFQGREREGRRDDHVLFTALIRPDLLAPWLAQITRHKVPLSGIYSLPLLSETLLKKIPVNSDQALLVSLQSSGGLRQTFFLRGQLKISRLAIMPQIEEPRYASYILGEVERIRRYLNSLRLLSREQPLDVYLMSHGEISADLRRQATDSLSVRHHLVDVADVASKLGIRGRLDSPWADLIFAWLLVRKEPGARSYAGPDETRYAVMNRIRQGMSVAAALLLLCGLAWGGLKFAEGLIAAQEVVSLDQQVGFYAERYRLARERLPESPADPREVKAAVEMAHSLSEHRSSPLPVMQAVSDALAPYPMIRLDDLNWIVSPDPEATVVRGPRASGTAPSRTSATPVPARAGTLYGIVRVKAHIAPFRGDYREAMGTVNGFANALSGVRGVESVNVISMPLNVSSQARVRGQAGVEAETGTAAFEVRVVMKVPQNEAL